MKDKKELYYRLRREGGSRVVAVGRVVPEDWRLVKIKILARDKNRVDLKLIKVA